MSAWPDKYVIGLTGNIATGKSVVRRMLEHLGAYTIDADTLAHRAMARGAPGYQPIVDHFGKWVLAPDGQIDRKRLGRIAFADPDAMRQLESILHPLVRQAMDILIRRSSQKVIVIEAIKLLEGKLGKLCDSIWVVDASPSNQLARLMKKRGFSEAEAQARMRAQPPQQEKVAAADIVINNNGSFESTWRQVLDAWKKLTVEQTAPRKTVKTEAGKFTVRKAGPREADKIAQFLTRLHKNQPTFTREDIMEAFGEKAFMLLLNGEELVGLAGWQVENLVTRITDFYLDPQLNLAEAAPDLIQAVEKASRELQSEASLLFLPPDMAQREQIWRQLGYEQRTIEGLDVRAWQEAARESDVTGTVMLFKQLRIDRVLRPI